MRFRSQLQTQKKTVFLLGAISLTLGLYWLGYHFSVSNSTQGQQYFVSQYEVLPEELPLSVANSVVTHELPVLDYLKVQGGHRWSSCAAPCAFVARFEIPKNNDSTDWGFAPSYNTDNFAVYVNGLRVMLMGQLEPTPSFHGKRSWLTRIPASLLSDDQATVVSLVLVRWSEPAAVRGAFIGPYVDLEAALAPRFFMYYDWPQYMAIAGLVLGIVVLVVLPLTRNRRMFLWFGVVAVSWSLLGLYRLWFDFPFSNTVRAFYYFMMLNTVYLALFNFFDFWSGQNARRQRMLAGTGYVLIFAIYVLLGDRISAAEKEALLGDPFQLLLSVSLLVKAVQHYFVQAETRLVESAAFFIVITAALSDVLAQVFGIFDFYSLTRALPFFLFAIAASLYYRNVRLYESERSMNELLNRELAQKERELKAGYEREQEMRKSQILIDERQRILQDMHDGVGGRLSALLQSQRNQPDSDPYLTQELQQSLQDLLLIIDSLDPDINEQLGSALGVLRTRLAPWLQEQKLELAWQVDLDPGLGLGPEKTLHLYRCLQEAISNVIRHAEAKIIRVVARQEGDVVSISVIDNGRGFDAEILAGRGIGNMKSRMSRVGGEVIIESNGYTKVTFSLPHKIYG